MDRDIFVISDLHVGDGGPRDNFALGDHVKELGLFLDHVERENAELVILGDLFEFWQMNISKLIVVRRSLLDRLSALNAIYVPGNHDIDLVHFIGTRELGHPFFARMSAPFVREIAGRRFSFFHGHEVDPFNASESPDFGRMLAIFAGLFEEQNGSPVLRSGQYVEVVLLEFGEAMLEVWNHLASQVLRRQSGGSTPPPDSARTMTPVQNPGRFAEHVHQVRGAREAQGFDVAILGHTHRAGRIGDWYHNTGTWAGSTDTFLRISPDGVVRLYEWKEGRPHERQEPVLWSEREATEKPAMRRRIEALGDSFQTLFPDLTISWPRRSRLFLVLSGMLALVASLVALLMWRQGVPLPRLKVLLASYMLADGVISLLSTWRERSLLTRLLGYLQAGVSMALGLVGLARPAFSFELVFFLLGVWGLLSGAVRVVAARLFGLALQRRWLLAGGVTSAGGGLALMIVSGAVIGPLVGLVWCWIALQGGISLVAGLFQRRKPPLARALSEGVRRQPEGLTPIAGTP